MFENIRADRMHYHNIGRRVGDEHSPLNILLLLWRRFGFQSLVIYRFGHWLGSLRKHRYGWVVAMSLYPVYWVLSVFVRKAYGIHLDQSADIAPGFCIMHFGGIEVRNCRIGPHCRIHQQVKLGPDKITGKGSVLVLGSGVVIGSHARICADVTIGDGVTIGAGAVVTQDIPANCLVLGNPGRIAQWNYDNKVL
jgi:serine O-acetyltransferase